MEERRRLELEELMNAARSSGFSFNEIASRGWLEAARLAVSTPGDIAQSDCGEFGGHELAMLDFDQADVDRLRAIGELVSAPAAPELESALAIAGSEAQGAIQLFPADADYFERWHFRTETKDDAISLFAALLRKNLEKTGAIGKFRLEEVWFGRRNGITLAWLPTEIETETLTRTDATGATFSSTWNDAALNPGFVKIDWILLDRTLGGPGRVSKVIDATWESPKGRIESLDGSIDADYQQIYLDRRGASFAADLTAANNALLREKYLLYMEKEIAKFSAPGASDHAKVAKRLYNFCRLTGRFDEAVFLREMFDDVPARLHQLRGRLEYFQELTIDEQERLVNEIQAVVADFTKEENDTAVAVLFQSATVDERLAALGMLIDRSFRQALMAVLPIAEMIAEFRDRHLSKPVEQQPENPAT